MNYVDTLVQLVLDTLGTNGFVLLLSLYGVIVVTSLAGLWKTFEKAGKPGWAALVPGYNFVLTCDVVGRPAWWIGLMFVPFVNLLVGAQISVDLAHAFERSTGFGLGLLFAPMVFYPWLGFGDAPRYVGPVAA